MCSPLLNDGAREGSQRGEGDESEREGVNKRGHSGEKGNKVTEGDKRGEENGVKKSGSGTNRE